MLTEHDQTQYCTCLRLQLLPLSKKLHLQTSVLVVPRTHHHQECMDDGLSPAPLPACYCHLPSRATGRHSRNDAQASLHEAVKLRTPAGAQEMRTGGRARPSSKFCFSGSGYRCNKRRLRRERLFRGPQRRSFGQSGQGLTSCLLLPVGLHWTAAALAWHGSAAKHSLCTVKAMEVLRVLIFLFNLKVADVQRVLEVCNGSLHRCGPRHCIRRAP